MADRILRVIIAGDTKGLRAAVGESIGETKKAGGAFEKLGKVAKVAFLGIVGGAATVAAASVHMADEYETSHARLVTALTNTGSSWKAQAKSIDAVTQSGAKLGYNAGQIEDALAVMTTGMGNSQKAVGLLGVAQDLAATKGIDLSAAALAVTKASEGQLKPIKALGIDLPIAAAGAVKLQTANANLKKAQDGLALVQQKIHAGLIKGPSAYLALAAAQNRVRDAQKKVNDTASAGDKIIAALGQKIGGAASAQADTFGGKIKALKTQMTDWGIKIGLALIPIIEKLADFIEQKVVPVVQSIADAVKRNWPQIQATAQQVFAKVQEVIQTVVDWVRQHWPQIDAVIQEVVAKVKPILAQLSQVFGSALAAVTAIINRALVVGVKLWDWFGQTILNHLKPIFNAIAQVISGVLLVLKGVLDFITGVFTGKWGKAWDGIKEIFAGVWRALGGLVKEALDEVSLALAVGIVAVGKVIGAVGHVISDAWDAIWGGLGDVVSGVFHAVVVVFTDAINQIIRVVNDAIQAYNDIPFHGDIKKIGYINAPAAPVHISSGNTNPNTHGPHRAAGGPVSALLPYTVGEHGPETFVPAASGTIIPYGAWNGGGGTTVNVDARGALLDAQSFARYVADMISRDKRNGGPVSIALRT